MALKKRRLTAKTKQKQHKRKGFVGQRAAQDIAERRRKRGFGGRRQPRRKHNTPGGNAAVEKD